MNTRKLRVAVVVLAAGLSGTAQAALQGRDLNGSADSFEAYYDTDLNITWLADANYSKTSGYDADGMMTWDQATTWAENLVFLDAINNITYDTWRLPTTLQPDASCVGSSFYGADGYGCIGSEMGHMFGPVLGGVAGSSISTTHNGYYDLFDNLQSALYWSGTYYVTNDVIAWKFNFYDGSQHVGHMGQSNFAWAVSAGDVGIAAVPEADTWAMLLAGLGLVVVAARRRPR